MSDVLENAIGIMGGTFDPIHYGHLAAAEAARFSFSLNKVIFVPTAYPPHKKKQGVTDPQIRYTMTEMAISTNPKFEISSVELRRKGPSYTVDTLREFRELYKGVQMYFITGADAILEIFTWKDVDALLKISQFIAVTRPGYKQKELDEIIKAIKSRYNKIVHVLSVPAVAISSSEIRKLCKRQRPIKYLLPESVEEFIYEHGVYYR